MDIGQVAKPFVMGVLGQTLGGPVAAVLSNVSPSQMGQLGQMLKGLSDQFSKSQGSAGTSVPQRPVPFSSTNININITINPLGSLQQSAASGPLQSFGKAPEVGSDAQMPGLASAVNNRITGSDANKGKFAMDGTNPWNKPGDKSDMAAVAWAMQKNDKVRFDADRQQFYTTDSKGQAHDVASLSEVKQQIANAGGASPSNGAAQAAVGSFLDGRIGQTGQQEQTTKSSQPAQTQQAANDNPFKQIMELLDKLLKVLMGGQQGAGGAEGASSNGGVAGGGSGAGQVGGASGGGSRAEGVGSGSGVGGSGGASGSSGAGGAGSVEGGSGGGSIESMVDKAGSSIDKMMGEAEKLMASDKPSDQLKGQMMMQKAQRMFEMISKMLEQRSQMQSKAIQAIK